MEHIWAPWRIAFIEKVESRQGCFLCEKPKMDDDRTNLILYRGKYNYILLNSYPYNPGHLMIAPYRHTGQLEELTDEESAEHIRLVQLGVKLLTSVLKPGGYNVGMNLGKVAGAGIADHIHSHIVPRWQGDTNFMPIIADTKVVPQALDESYTKLSEGIRSLL
jgi:ATP adenylyltransferase